EIELYNLIHTGNGGDVDYYLKKCRDAESVLELGCGSGRITIPIGASGISVTGIDIDKEMLAVFKSDPGYSENRDKLLLHQGDMRDFNLNKLFDLVIIPYNSLLCMTTFEDAVTVLKNAKRHLKPGGEVIFDIYYVEQNDLSSIERDGFWDLGVFKDTNDAEIIVTEQAIDNDDIQRLDTAYHFVYETGSNKGATHELLIKQRAIVVEDIKKLVESAGLKLVSIKNAFDEETITDDTEQIVVVASN
ncbi:MAG: class I SAM-dependent methyltransferase, partial [Deltaproteobacteria bacterium]|nr:class I SAM-dependent methyltransferase [Deltaproteobacteria bacterium]